MNSNTLYLDPDTNVCYDSFKKNYFSFKLFKKNSFKVDIKALDPDPNQSKILDQDPNSMYLDPQPVGVTGSSPDNRHPEVYRYGTTGQKV